MPKKVLLVAGDVYRPAAIDQLIALGKRIEVRTVCCLLYYFRVRYLVRYVSPGIWSFNESIHSLIFSNHVFIHAFIFFFNSSVSDTPFIEAINIFQLLTFSVHYYVNSCRNVHTLERVITLSTMACQYVAEYAKNMPFWDKAMNISRNVVSLGSLQPFHGENRLLKGGEPFVVLCFEM